MDEDSLNERLLPSGNASFPGQNCKLIRRPYKVVMKVSFNVSVQSTVVRMFMKILQVY